MSENIFNHFHEDFMEAQDKVISEIMCSPACFEADKSPVLPDRGCEINLVGSSAFNIEVVDREPTNISIKPMLFAWDAYEELGGWNDFKGFFDTIDQAKKYVNDNLRDHYEGNCQVVLNGKIILKGSSVDNYKWQFQDMADGEVYQQESDIS